MSNWLEQQWICLVRKFTGLPRRLPIRRGRHMRKLVDSTPASPPALGRGHADLRQELHEEDIECGDLYADLCRDVYTVMQRSSVSSGIGQ